MSKENLEKAVGKEIEIAMLINFQSMKFLGTLKKINYPMSITVGENGADYIIPLIGTAGGIKSISSDGKEIYSNTMLDGKYPRGFGMSGEGLKKLHEFRKLCFGKDYEF
ncbi:hypothetical protein HYT25_00135 [Candidatus Pacearchaeota archaeon]|nr:hypothetical protein [Candidatus Pacearchaeota archaeon]